MAFRFSLMIALLLTLPFATAGSQHDPEIADGTNDVDVQHGGAIALGAPEIDLTAAWFNTNATTLNVTLQVVDASHRIQSDESVGYSMTFHCGGEWVFVEANIGPLVHYAEWWKERNSDGTLTGWGVATWSIDGNVIHVDVPRSALSCTTLTTPLASSLIAYHVGSSWTSGGASVRSGDVAPNSGYGRDYAMP